MSRMALDWTLSKRHIADIGEPPQTFEEYYSLLSQSIAVSSSITSQVDVECHATPDMVITARIG